MAYNTNRVAPVYRNNSSLAIQAPRASWLKAHLADFCMLFGGTMAVALLAVGSYYR